MGMVQRQTKTVLMDVCVNVLVVTQDTIVPFHPGQLHAMLPQIVLAMVPPLMRTIVMDACASARVDTLAVIVPFPLRAMLPWIALAMAPPLTLTVLMDVFAHAVVVGVALTARQNHLRMVPCLVRSKSKLNQPTSGCKMAKIHLLQTKPRQQFGKSTNIRLTLPSSHFVPRPEHQLLMAST